MLDCRKADGFGDESVHAGGESLLALFVESVGGHGDDGSAVLTALLFSFPDRAGCIEPI